METQNTKQPATSKSNSISILNIQQHSSKSRRFIGPSFSGFKQSLRRRRVPPLPLHAKWRSSCAVSSLSKEKQSPPWQLVWNFNPRRLNQSILAIELLGCRVLAIRNLRGRRGAVCAGFDRSALAVGDDSQFAHIHADKAGWRQRVESELDDSRLFCRVEAVLVPVPVIAVVVRAQQAAVALECTSRSNVTSRVCLVWDEFPFCLAGTASAVRTKGARRNR